MSMERPHDAGLGTGGKFRKRPFRRSPYDRPPTSASIGWLSKLASSIFRKRLPPPEANQEPRDEYKEAVSLDSPGPQEACVNANSNPSNISNNGGLIELEQNLRQKTFTRSEVDRLTSLLRSRSDEMFVDGEEKRAEEIRFKVTPSQSMLFHDRKEAHPNTPPCENGIQNHRTSTPVGGKTVLDEDVASPAELAKAFMRSRPSKVSPSMLSLYSQAFGEDSTVIRNPSFPPKSPIMSLVQRSHAAVPANVFLTPTSQGRSAMYNVARTPYSRVQQNSGIKGSGAMINLYKGPSSMSPQYDGEINKPSESQQGALKRRSSVLENDIGFVGPMRRIRQKSNLVYQKSLSSPVSSQHPSSKNLLTENGDISRPGSSFTPVPSKSKEMASKILAHLETLTPKEKSPTKLSPSMLRGKALRSLENPDSSKVFESIHHNNKLDGCVNSSAYDAQQSASQKNDQNNTNGPSKFLSIYEKVAPAEHHTDATVSVKDTVPSFNADNSGLKNTIAYSPQKNQSLKMSAHKDFLNLDDNIISNGVASTPSTEDREKLGNSISESKTMVSEAAKADKHPALSEVKPSTSFILNWKPNSGVSNGSTVIEESTSLAFPTSSSMTVQPAAESTPTSFASGKDVLSKEPAAPYPILIFRDKNAVPKEASAAPTFGLGSKNADEAPQSIFTFSSTSSLTDSSSVKFGNSSDPKPGSLSSFLAVSAGPTSYVSKVSESAEALTENNLKSEVLSKIPEPCPVSTSTPVAGIVAFGAANSSNLKNGSFSSSPSPYSSSMPSRISGNTTSQNSSSSATLSGTSTSINTSITSTSLPVFTLESSLPASPIFKFGSSAAPSHSVVPLSGASGAEIMEPKVKQDTSFGNTSNTLFGVPATASGTGSSIFGFSAAAPPANSQSQGSTPFGGSSVSPSSAGSGVATVTKSMPAQFGSSGTSPLFGSSGSSAFSSLSSPFGNSAPAATPFSSGAGFGSSSFASSSDGKKVNPGGGAVSGLFGSSWQQPTTKSPIFASSNTRSSSTGSSFGASAASVASTNSVLMAFGSSSTSVAATNSSPMPFGSSTPSGALTNSASTPFGSIAGDSSGSLFSFTAAATGSSIGTSSGHGFSFTSASPTAIASSSQHVFGKPSPVFGFGSASASNDQMNMEDNSMSEDAVQASTPTFSQQPFSPAVSSFVFGSTAANPFQFGGQQNPATQQTSPFQASGSLGLNASGNFSLGTGGGDKSNRKIVKINKSKHRRK